MATNHFDSIEAAASVPARDRMARNLRIATGDAWVATLTQPAPERRLWCEECHYWHREVNECAYVTKAGA